MKSRLSLDLEQAQLDIENRWTIIKRVYYKVYEAILYRPDWYYNIKQFFINLPLFLKMAKDYRSWSATDSLECFMKLLEKNAQELDNGLLLHGKRYARRCRFAIHLLNRAYINPPDNKVLDKLNSDNPIKIEDRKVTVEYKTMREEQYYKYARFLFRQEAKLQKQREKDAWEYICHHFNYFTD